MPKFIRHIVPPEFEGKVRTGKRAERLLGHALCRFDICQTYAQYPNDRYEGLCWKHSTLYSIANMMIREARIHACEAALNTDPEDLSLFEYLLTHCSPSGNDADVHMSILGLPWCHFTDVDLENDWVLTDGKIVLVCNDDLDVLPPHWKDLDKRKRNPKDINVWGTTHFLGGIDFMRGHHKQDLTKGKVLYCLGKKALICI